MVKGVDKKKKKFMIKDGRNNSVQNLNQGNGDITREQETEALINHGNRCKVQAMGGENKMPSRWEEIKILTKMVVVYAITATKNSNTIPLDTTATFLMVPMTAKAVSIS